MGFVDPGHFGGSDGSDGLLSLDGLPKGRLHQGHWGRQERRERQGHQGHRVPIDQKEKMETQVGVNLSADQGSSVEDHHYPNQLSQTLAGSQMRLNSYVLFAFPSPSTPVCAS